VKRTAMLAVTAFAFGSAAAQGPSGETFSPERIGKGAETFAVFCTPCHGERMNNPEFFDLKAFPSDQHSRFVDSVTNGKNAMPPWRGQLTPDDIEALWSYVIAGEKDNK
jgi:mono/diheme cytochrome c family protein